ncbi:unnamed protein product [marine sediment metagenome]|uniref:Uncharacterized protein n=1 Tax=marine sediment metagenome TaxID=412755 RepID=X0VAQ6_9ZZZZ
MDNINIDDSSISGGMIALIIIVVIVGIFLTVLFWYFVWKYFKGQSQKTDNTFEENKKMCLEQFKNDDTAKEKCLHDIIEQKTSDKKRQTHEKEGLAAAVIAEDFISHM